MPEPIPRPTRLRPVFAFFGARRLDRFIAMIFLAHAPIGIQSHRLAFVIVWSAMKFHDRELADYKRLTTRELVQDADEMWDGLDHATDRLIVHTLNDLVEAGKA